MGKQSARLYFEEKDHKDIFFQGAYHDKMYKGSELVWEKLHGDKYFVAKCLDEIFVFYIDTKSFRQSKNANVDSVSKSSEFLAFYKGENTNIYYSTNGIYWNNTQFVPPDNIPGYDLSLELGKTDSQIYAYIFDRIYIKGIAVINKDGTCNQYINSASFNPNPSGSLTYLPFAIKNCNGVYPERVLSRFMIIQNSAYQDAYVCIGKIENGNIVYYTETFLTYEDNIYFSFFVNNYFYCYSDKTVEYASVNPGIESGYGEVNSKTISFGFSKYGFEAKEVFFVGSKAVVYGMEYDENLNPVPVILESTDYYNFKKTTLPNSLSVKELNSNRIITIYLTGQGDYNFVFGTIKESSYYEDENIVEKEHIGIGIKRTTDLYATGFSYIDNLYFNESENNICWIFN